MKTQSRFAFAFSLVLSLLAGLVVLQSGAASGHKEIATVTFNKNIAPIFFKSCAECHRPGEAAPFSVLSYKETRPGQNPFAKKSPTAQCLRGTPTRISVNGRMTGD